MTSVKDLFGLAYKVESKDPGYEVVKALEKAGYQKIILPTELLLGYTMGEFNIEQYVFDVTAEDSLDTIRLQECVTWLVKRNQDSK